jgi:hypothetical protein
VIDDRAYASSAPKMRDADMVAIFIWTRACGLVFTEKHFLVQPQSAQSGDGVRKHFGRQKAATDIIFQEATQWRHCNS